MNSVSLSVLPTSTARLEGEIIFILVTWQSGRGQWRGGEGRGAGDGVARLAVHNLHGQVKLLNHAQGDGAPARLAVVQLALDEERLNASLGKRLRGAGARRAAANDLGGRAAHVRGGATACFVTPTHRDTKLATAERLATRAHTHGCGRRSRPRPARGLRWWRRAASGGARTECHLSPNAPVATASCPQRSRSSERPGPCWEEVRGEEGSWADSAEGP